MKPSKYDKYICLFSLMVFFYYFFVVGGTPVYWNEGEVDNQGIVHYRGELKGVEYSTIVFIGPLIFMMFFFFMVFETELRPVTIWTGLVAIIVSYKIIKYQIGKRLHFKY